MEWKCTLRASAIEQKAGKSPHARSVELHHYGKTSTDYFNKYVEQIS